MMIEEFLKRIAGLRGDVYAYSRFMPTGEPVAYWSREMNPSGDFVRVDQILPIIEELLCSAATCIQGIPRVDGKGDVLWTAIEETESHE